jgi:hypothetical protein
MCLKSCVECRGVFNLCLSVFLLGSQKLKLWFGLFLFLRKIKKQLVILPSIMTPRNEFNVLI